MTSQSNRVRLTPKERRRYGLARARDLAFDAVQTLWRRRRSEGMKQLDIANAIDREPAWVSRNLRAPGNWTLRTLGELVEGLGGELEIKVHAMEDKPETPQNYSAYAGYEPPAGRETPQRPLPSALDGGQDASRGTPQPSNLTKLPEPVAE